MWKTVRVNVNTGEITKTDYKKEYNSLGGRSLIAQFLIDEVNPECDALGAENKLIICLGIFGGTTVTTANRLFFGAKSPLTGTIKESNSGGTAAASLAAQGIKMLVLEDIPQNDELKNILIDKDGNISLVPAGSYVGLNNYDIVEKAFEEFGKDVSTISIGVAGERKYLAAAIAVPEFKTGHPCRIAARGGLGAVMGSKGIKMIIIEKAATKFKPPLANQELFDSARNDFNKTLAAACPNFGMAQFGTIGNINHVKNGVMPVKNFSGAVDDNFEKINVAAFDEIQKDRGGRRKVACQAGCVIACSNIYHDADGKHLTSGMEYETVALFGPNLLIEDYDFIAKMDRFCDDFGLDTIDLGCAFGVAMDAGRVPWGDVEKAYALTEEIRNDTEFGRVLGSGVYRTGKYLGCKRIPAAKKQGFPAYDPRNLKGTGVTYATSTMGADHTAGITFGAPLDQTKNEGMVGLSKQMQLMCALADSTLCLFATLLGSRIAFDKIMLMYNGVVGTEFTDPKQLFGLSVKTLMNEITFNKKAGITEADDTLEEYLKIEPSIANNTVFDFTTEELQDTHKFA